MAEDGSGSKDGPEKVKLYGTVISAVSSLIAIAVFLGWDDDIKKAIPFADTTTTAPAQPTRLPIPAAAEPELSEVVDPTTEETTEETTTEETTTTTETPSPEELRQAYIRQADAACAPAIGNRPARVATLDYGYMMSVLESRNRMLQDWRSVVVEPRDAGNYARIQQLWNDFNHASAYWNYMANALLARNSATFDAELERYRAATAAFVNGATRYGFAMCGFGWNSVSG
ncbi:hypothetical protein IOD16_16405 [Saccharothrix sp. 6-C]|uniref:hypothetical protein n=1 Tax=Saccharothrix sp. 6-C TaxID=2781735 RepID=UPI001916E74B|nr:hypothetical protein [Saccharothrix sp. 6-C]QQQ79832.1 hypothetical protein IOD16_16405 [Saccharothrix sp. 6-C]